MDHGRRNRKKGLIILIQPFLEVDARFLEPILVTTGVNPQSYSTASKVPRSMQEAKKSDKASLRFFF